MMILAIILGVIGASSVGCPNIADRFSAEKATVCDISANHSRTILPSSIREANEDRSFRVSRMIKYYSETWGAQKNTPMSENSYIMRQYAARALWILNFGTIKDKEDFRIQLEGYAKTLRVYEEIGTDGDYDMDMQDLIAFLAFFHDPKYRSIVSDQAFFDILSLGLNPGRFASNASDDLMMHYNSTLSSHFPETENHILMMATNRYLMNQIIAQNKRSLNMAAFPKYSNEGSPVEDLLFQATARIIHLDYFETNGRPYQSLSMQAILNLFQFAENSAMRNAAKAALDFTFAKLVFTSFEGKRSTPFRRNAENFEFYHMLEKDGPTAILALMTGVYRWNDMEYYRSTNRPHGFWFGVSDYRVPDAIHDFAIRRYGGYAAHFFPAYSRQHYRQSYWPFYLQPTGKFYTGSRDGSGLEYYYSTDAYMNVSQGTGASYPTSLDWFNSLIKENIWYAGGFYNMLNKDDFKTVLNEANWKQNYELRSWARMNVVLSRSPGYWKSYADIAKFSPTFDGDGPGMNPYNLYNITTYKGLTQYYSARVKSLDPRNTWPISVPPTFVEKIPKITWLSANSFTSDDMRYFMNFRSKFGYYYPVTRANAEKMHAAQTSTEGIQFRFFDGTKDPNFGYYLVACAHSFGGRYNGPVIPYQNVSKNILEFPGFWEVVPKSRFQNIESLVEYVLSKNDAAGVSGRSDGYWTFKYTMTSGEKIEFSKAAGIDNHVDGRNSSKQIGGGVYPDYGAKWIYSITSPNGQELSTERFPYLNNIDDNAERNKWPLVSVKQVNESGLFTGLTYAFGMPDGLISICNPGTGTSQVLDARNYRKSESYEVAGNACSDAYTANFATTVASKVRLPEAISPRKRLLSIINN